MPTPRHLGPTVGRPERFPAPLNYATAEAMSGFTSEDLRVAFAAFSKAAAIHPILPRASRRLFSTTETLLNAIAPLAMIGESSHPVNGNSTPAAMGMPTTL